MLPSGSVLRRAAAWRHPWAPPEPAATEGREAAAAWGQPTCAPPRGPPAPAAAAEGRRCLAPEPTRRAWRAGAAEGRVAARADHASDLPGPAYVIPREPADRNGAAGRRRDRDIGHTSTDSLKSVDGPSSSDDCAAVDATDEEPAGSGGAAGRRQEAAAPQPEALAAPGGGPDEPGDAPAAGEDDHGVGEDAPNLLTLGVHLHALQREDPGCVFVARGIHVLGFESPQMLMEHYSAFGEVTNVLVSHSKVKPYRSRRSAKQWRIRPGGIGFVVMADAASADRILQAGAQQTVAGRSVVLEPFRAMPAKAGSASTVDPGGSTSSPSGSGGSHAGSRGSAGSSEDGAHDRGV